MLTQAKQEQVDRVSGRPEVRRVAPEALLQGDLLDTWQACGRSCALAGTWWLCLRLPSGMLSVPATYPLSGVLHSQMGLDECVMGLALHSQPAEACLVAPEAMLPHASRPGLPHCGQQLVAAVVGAPLSCCR